MSGSDVHPSSIIDSGAVLGNGTKVWHFCHVSAGARIGSECVLGQNVFVGANVVIGHRVKIQNNVSIFEGVTLEDDVFVGPSVTFTNVRTPRAAVSRRDEFESTIVRFGASIGANATILCGLEIGAHSLIGAGAVVTRNVAPNAVVYGNPASNRGWACVCGTVLSDDGMDRQCQRCGRRYQIVADALAEISSPA
jgi:UDP-2-acetamido-3-amino-2,3-dideoxy-glucuronate N-acetyltransferase